MSLKVQRGKQEFLAHHGLIKMIVSDALRSLRHIILWEYFINMDRQAFEEVQEAMSEEEKKKGEEPKRVTRPKKSRQQKKKKKKKLDEKDKEVVDALTALGTPIVSPLKITSAEWVQPRRRRSNRIKSQKKEILVSTTPLTITSQVEEIKDSPSPEQQKETKGKEPQEETVMKEEIPMEGTSKTKTHVEKLLYATLLELEQAKVDAIKWKRVEEDNKGKMKEEVAQELEQQLQLMQEKFQIMTMQKVEYNQKLKVENQKLQQQLSKARRDLHEKSEQVEIMEATIKTIAKVSEEMLECRPPSEHTHCS
jgi:hypothetical protein